MSSSDSTDESWLGDMPRSLSQNELGALSYEDKQAYRKKLLSWREKRGHWYKFDDDKVTAVLESTAIQECFGREKTEFGLGSISSAYMLVYIRECDAESVCQCCRTSFIVWVRLLKWIIFIINIDYASYQKF